MESRRRTKAKIASKPNSPAAQTLQESDSSEVNPPSPGSESTETDNVQEKAGLKAKKRTGTIAMVCEAIEALGSDKKGTSVQAIKKWISTKYSNGQENHQNFDLKKVLVKALLDGTLVRPPKSKTVVGAIGSFCLPKKPTPKDGIKVNSKQKATSKASVPPETLQSNGADPEATSKHPKKSSAKDTIISKQKTKITRKKASAAPEIPQGYASDPEVTINSGPVKTIPKRKARNTRKETSEGYVSDSEVTINKGSKQPRNTVKINLKSKKATANVDVPHDSGSDFESNMTKVLKRSPLNGTIKVNLRQKSKNAPVSLETQMNSLSDSEVDMTLVPKKSPAKNIKNAKKAIVSLETQQDSLSESEDSMTLVLKKSPAKNIKNAKKAIVSLETQQDSLSDSEDSMTLVLKKSPVKNIKNAKKAIVSLETQQGSQSESEDSMTLVLKKSPVKNIKNAKKAIVSSETLQGNLSESEESMTLAPKKSSAKNTMKVRPRQKDNNTKEEIACFQTLPNNMYDSEMVMSNDMKRTPSDNSNISSKLNSMDTKLNTPVSMETDKDLMSDSEVTINKSRTKPGWLHLSDTELDEVRKSIAFKKPKRTKKTATGKSKVNVKSEEGGQSKKNVALSGKKTKTSDAILQDKDVTSAKLPRKTKAAAKENADPKEMKVSTKRRGKNGD